MGKFTQIVAALALILLQNSAQATAQLRSSDVSGLRRPNFQFVSGKSFDRIIPEAGPKDWKRSEIELIKNLLPKIHAHAPTLMAKAKLLGQNQFARWESKVSA